MGTVVDYAKIALIAFVGVWVINRALSAAGLGQYTTSGTASASL